MLMYRIFNNRYCCAFSCSHFVFSILFSPVSLRVILFCFIYGEYANTPWSWHSRHTHSLSHSLLLTPTHTHPLTPTHTHPLTRREEKREKQSERERENERKEKGREPTDRTGKKKVSRGSEHVCLLCNEQEEAKDSTVRKSKVAQSIREKVHLPFSLQCVLFLVL